MSGNSQTVAGPSGHNTAALVSGWDLPTVWQNLLTHASEIRLNYSGNSICDLLTTDNQPGMFLFNVFFCERILSRLSELGLIDWEKQPTPVEFFLSNQQWSYVTAVVRLGYQKRQITNLGYLLKAIGKQVGHKMPDQAFRALVILFDCVPASKLDSFVRSPELRTLFESQNNAAPPIMAALLAALMNDPEKSGSLCEAFHRSQTSRPNNKARVLSWMEWIEKIPNSTTTLGHIKEVPNPGSDLSIIELQPAALPVAPPVAEPGVGANPEYLKHLKQLSELKQKQTSRSTELSNVLQFGSDLPSGWEPWGAVDLFSLSGLASWYEIPPAEKAMKKIRSIASAQWGIPNPPPSNAINSAAIATVVCLFLNEGNMLNTAAKYPNGGLYHEVHNVLAGYNSNLYLKGAAHGIIACYLNSFYLRKGGNAILDLLIDCIPDGVMFLQLPYGFGTLTPDASRGAGPHNTKWDFLDSYFFRRGGRLEEAVTRLRMPANGKVLETQEVAWADKRKLTWAYLLWLASKGPPRVLGTLHTNKATDLTEYHGEWDVLALAILNDADQRAMARTIVETKSAPELADFIKDLIEPAFCAKTVYLRILMEQLFDHLKRGAARFTLADINRALKLKNPAGGAFLPLQARVSELRSNNAVFLKMDPTRNFYLFDPDEEKKNK